VHALLIAVQVEAASDCSATRGEALVSRRMPESGESSPGDGTRSADQRGTGSPGKERAAQSCRRREQSAGACVDRLPSCRVRSPPLGRSCHCAARRRATTSSICPPSRMATTAKPRTTNKTKPTSFFNTSHGALRAAICFNRKLFSSLNCSSSLSLWKLLRKTTSLSLLRTRISRIDCVFLGFATNTLNTWNASN